MSVNISKTLQCCTGGFFSLCFVSNLAATAAAETVKTNTSTNKHELKDREQKKKP